MTNTNGQTDTLRQWHAQHSKGMSVDPVAYAQGWEPHIPMEGKRAGRLLRALAWALLGAALVGVLL